MNEERGKQLRDAADLADLAEALDKLEKEKATKLAEWTVRIDQKYARKRAELIEGRSAEVLRLAGLGTPQEQ
jgi:hypothetical protein